MLFRGSRTSDSGFHCFILQTNQTTKQGKFNLEQMHRHIGKYFNARFSYRLNSPVVKSKSTSPARKSAPKPEPEPPKKMEPVAASDFFGSKKVQQAPPPPRKERDPNAPPPAPAPTKKDKKRKSNSPEKPAPGAVDEFVSSSEQFVGLEILDC